MNKAAKHFYEFGPFRVDTTEHVLLRDGQAIQLKGKIYDLLVELVANSGHILMKHELMNRIWPDSFVEEHNLAVSISALRKALGGNDHIYIETVPRRGYRFVAGVREVWDGDLEEHYRNEPPFNADGKTRDAPVKSIAVLPFKTIGTKASEESYLGLGMADALITRISNLKQIIVRPTSAVRRYADSEEDPVVDGQELKVSFVLDGSIQRSGQRIRVTVQLVNVQDGASLWAGTFDETFTNVFAVEDSISEQVARALILNLTVNEKRQLRKRYTENTEAYQAYLKGRYFLTKRTEEAFEKGIEYFKEAIRIDPEYALAYAGLADYYQFLSNYNEIRAKEAALEAKRAVLKALELDETLAEAHISLAYMRAYREWNWSDAEREYQRAIQLNSNHPIARQWYSIYLRLFKRFDEAEIEIKKAQELDPLSATINTSIGSLLYFDRRYDEAVEQFWKVIELDPNYVLAHFYLGWTYEQKGMLGESIKAFKKVLGLSGNVSEFHAGLGRAYAISGRRSEAQDILNTLKEPLKHGYVSPYHLALIHVGLGENDQALDCLEKGFDERCIDMALLNVDQRLDILRREFRFVDLMQRMGFPLAKA